MKYLLIGLLALSSGAAMAKVKMPEATSNVKAVKFVGDLKFSAFCKAVITDDLALFRTSIARQVGTVASNRKDVLRKLTSEEQGMTCAGSSLVEFAKQRDADEVHAFIVQQV
ncbi:hypothetical protein [Neptunicella marina]|uniref:DUF3718 domain-containing protein n=1 Tax=Neptunicella marina TaxID=2125989 RepID=A0A8J6M1Y1_9ALTE|nr:hypothetical protein [Neptunicella marina]MBC3765847.1 hypothetical protein [Neptunicella marina]